MVKRKVSHTTFSKAEVLRYGWEITKKNLWFFIRIIMIPLVIGWVLSFIDQLLLKNSLLLPWFIVFIASLIVDLEFTFAKTALFFKFADKKKTSEKELFVYFDAGLLFRFFLVDLLFKLLVFVGLLFFIFPGIYLNLKYWFAPYIFVDKRTGVIASFKESARLTKGIKGQLFLLGVLQVLIILAGTLAFLVGLYVAIPINYISDIYLYRKLSAKS